MNDYPLELGTTPRRRRKRTTYPPFSIDATQRLKHLLVLGKSGQGKSTALTQYAIKDIYQGLGCLYIDPHGSDAELLLSLIPPRRRKDVVFFNPAEFPVSFNVLDDVPEKRKPFIASSLVDALKIIWEMPYAPNVEMFVYTAIAALLETKNATIFQLHYMLTKPAYRATVIAQIKDPVIRDFWTDFYEHHLSEKEQRDRTLSTLNKLITLIADPTIRNCIGQPKSALNFNDVLANRKIVIVSVPQGDIGLDKVRIIVGFLLVYFHVAALQRADRTLFPVYINEAHWFMNKTIIEMQTGARKFGVSLCLSLQSLLQIEDPRLRAAVLGSVDSLLCFKLGPDDAETLARNFTHVKPDDLITLPPYRAYAVVGNQTEQLWMPDITLWRYPRGPRAIRRMCLSRYSRPRKAVEAEIANSIPQPQNAKRRKRYEARPSDWDG